ncbi:nucleotide-diphospho-sugar transferase [Nitzschia inconspicua]|uniref:Nucleotide-diphospho-sugar transferase n=1 Tax=Nitzschia inconspicua TaxID=303405 RepID=A0A9K3K628_9STRA|nr:nucleotide-diphospho-sugar transferase [Nitzschia inconspicua]
MYSQRHAAPPTSGIVERSSSQQKISRNRVDRSLIILVGVLAYIAGVITGILSSQSISATLSVQWDPPAQLGPPASQSASSLGWKKFNETVEKNRQIKEQQQQNQHKDFEQLVRQLKQQQNQSQALEQQVEQLHRQVQNLRKASNVPTPYKTGNNDLPLFPQTVKQLVVDYATVSRDDFNQILDIGVPYDLTTKGGEEVLLLYTTPGAVPAVHHKGNRFGLNATKAIENCNVVKVILQKRHDHRRKHVKQCIALVPNWDSFYVHNFQRLRKQESAINITGERLTVPGEPVNDNLPLRYTSRNHDDDGKTFETVPRGDWYTRPFYKVLAGYLQNFDRVLGKVQTFIKANIKIKDETTTMNKKQTLVVMTVNKGQSVLFHNFVCHSRKRGIDLSHIIMFATDKTALQLCRDLGIPAFYDESVYGKFPEHAAKLYGDATFAKMMIAKVICVHLILYSNYNVLFQDVDVLWFKNPLEFLQSPELEEWDMIFQDDGSRQTRFRPYSANSGFYFVRNNDITRFFFSTLLRMGDVMTSDHSHQSALVSFLNEFASWKGLRAKCIEWP